MKTIIVGAGLSGILLAKELNEAVILEKSKGVGGRLAARRLCGIGFNHGPEELSLWNHQHITDPHGWIKNESQGLNIQFSWEVEKIRLPKGGVEVIGTQGQIISGTKIVLTSPAPQTKAILERSGLEADFLESVKYTSTVQLMLVSESVIDFCDLDTFLDCHRMKRLDNGLFYYFFVSKKQFLPKLLEMDKQEIKDFFLSKIEANILDSHVHKWRYAEVEESISPTAQNFHKGQGIFLAGDYFGKDGIKSSYDSTKKVLANFIPELLQVQSKKNSDE